MRAKRVVLTSDTPNTSKCSQTKKSLNWQMNRVRIRQTASIPSVIFASCISARAQSTSIRVHHIFGTKERYIHTGAKTFNVLYSHFGCRASNSLELGLISKTVNVRTVTWMICWQPYWAHPWQSWQGGMSPIMSAFSRLSKKIMIKWQCSYSSTDWMRMVHQSWLDEDGTSILIGWGWYIDTD